MMIEHSNYDGHDNDDGSTYHTFGSKDFLSVAIDPEYYNGQEARWVDCSNGLVDHPQTDYLKMDSEREKRIHDKPVVKADPLIIHMDCGEKTRRRSVEITEEEYDPANPMHRKSRNLWHPADFYREEYVPAWGCSTTKTSKNTGSKIYEEVTCGLCRRIFRFEPETEPDWLKRIKRKK
jgi:hypothetical protein